MKKPLLLVSLLLLSFSVFADIGPSPSFSFSIANPQDFPDFVFYYAGNIWPDKLSKISPDVFVYKLNTFITVYAVPVELATSEEISGSDASEAMQQAIVSQQIELGSGQTVFSVESFDVVAGSMSLKVESNEPGTGGDFDLFGGSVFLFLGVIAIVVVVVLFVVLKCRPQQPQTPNAPPQPKQVQKK